ncbi:carnitine acetyltransferase [Phellopilus nigrolimitatus]|nr:carnitine acetyltransferase [Phellopilus nigrolimitatus]
MLSRSRKISNSLPLMSKRRVSQAAPASAAKPLRLPRLPVPLLRGTLDRYLKSLEPFLLEDEACGGPPFRDALQARVAWAEEYERGLGKTCQERLIELDRKSPYNWLDDNFWLNKAYLEWRAPLLVNSNWWLAYKHDRSVPACVTEGLDQDKRAGISSWQIRRAAWLLRRTLEFKKRLESQELYPDTTRTGLWMRDTVPRMFNVCRIPQNNCDKLSSPQLPSPYHNKVLVMIHDWIYVLDVYDSEPLETEHRELERRIRDVVIDAEGRLMSGERAPPVAVLSSDDRETWAKNRSYLLRLSSSNQNIMRAVEDSILVLCLDHYTHATTDPYPSELKSHLHNIRSGVNARNRWFDKGVTLIVENNARAGMMGEHSPVDALVPSIVADYSLAEDMESDTDWALLEPFTLQAASPQPRGWARLDWTVDDHLRQECREAEKRAKAIIADSDDDVHCFTDYGSDWMKNIAQLPPDAYIQMAMQLAWYRTRGNFTATYETALTRLFLHGRTETIRTLTTDSRQFILAMCDSATPTEVRCDLLRKAVKTHGSLTKAAATGKGVDRHMLGLRLVMKSNESSPLFEDNHFSKSQEWKLSTSGLSAGEYFRGTGFGTPYNDGYGINYLAGSDIIKFGVESKFSCKETSTEGFKDAIFSSLNEMRNLLLNPPLSDNPNFPRPRL